MTTPKKDTRDQRLSLLAQQAADDDMVQQRDPRDCPACGERRRSRPGGELYCPVCGFEEG